MDHIAWVTEAGMPRAACRLAIFLYSHMCVHKEWVKHYLKDEFYIITVSLDSLRLVQCESMNVEMIDFELKLMPNIETVDN